MANLRVGDNFAYSLGMPYVFPNEDLFMGGMAVLIIALLILRSRVARQRRLSAGTGTSQESPTEHGKGSFPLV